MNEPARPEEKRITVREVASVQGYNGLNVLILFARGIM
jgi:hypothetical protein